MFQLLQFEPLSDHVDAYVDKKGTLIASEGKKAMDVNKLGPIHSIVELELVIEFGGTMRRRLVMAVADEEGGNKGVLCFMEKEWQEMCNLVPKK